ncbi:MAG: hypothetical protein ACJAZ9_000122 [Neolewinella sp.]|jgi:hypothetical protein
MNPILQTLLILCCMPISLVAQRGIVVEPAMQWQFIKAYYGNVSSDSVKAVYIGAHQRHSHGFSSQGRSFPHNNDWQAVTGKYQNRESLLPYVPEKQLDTKLLDSLVSIIRNGDSLMLLPFQLPAADRGKIKALLEDWAQRIRDANRKYIDEEKQASIVNGLMDDYDSLDRVTARDIGLATYKIFSQGSDRYDNNLYIDLVFHSGKGLRITKAYSDAVHPVSFWTLHVDQRSFIFESNLPQQIFNEYLGEQEQVLSEQVLAQLLWYRRKINVD